MAYPLNTEGTASGNSDVEDEVVPVGWGWRDGKTGIIWTGKDRRPTMEARYGVEDGLVGDGDLESGDVDLLWAAEKFLHLVGDNRGLIVGQKQFRGRVLVKDGIVEGFDGEP